jgi:hypothetical protein
MDGWMDGQTGGWTNGWMDGWTDGWMDEYKAVCTYLMLSQTIPDMLHVCKA